MMNPDTIMQGVSDWQGSNVSFWFVTIIVVMSAFVAALSRSIVQAAFALFFTLLGMAGYYVLLGSGFLAITQVIIYVGGILVLLMFGVLLTNRPLQREQKGTTFLYAIGGSLGALFLLFVLVRIISTIAWQQATTLAPPPSDVRPIGMMLLSKYLLPFELAGMTLLLCLVGAAYLVRRRER